MKEEALQELEQQLAKCKECKLCEFAKGPVGWFGCAETPIVFVGEGPGGVEDDYGCPLIGPSGQLLDKALWATKMTRDRVIGNRTPNIAEADFCAQRWLEKELEILQPKVIVALGSVALHYLGSQDMRITRDRGKWFKTRQGYDCIATYHPAYLLRLADPHVLNHAKWEVFYDLEAARKKAEEAVPDYKFMSEEKTDLFKLFKKR